MNVKDLILKLTEYDLETEVVVGDYVGGNDFGWPNWRYNWMSGDFLELRKAVIEKATPLADRFVMDTKDLDDPSDLPKVLVIWP